MYASRISVALAIICFIGCGGIDHPDVGKVSGTVTLDQKPLAEATVMFQPPNGRASTGTTDSNGNYTLTYIDGVQGAMLGTHKIIIRTEIPGEDGKPPIAKEKLPKKYHDKSNLTAEVKAGSNKHDFQLNSR